MFKDFKELSEFIVFINTHYEISELWNRDKNDIGVLFEGPFKKSKGCQDYSPFDNNLSIDEQIYSSDQIIDNVYKTWKNIKKNHKISEIGRELVDVNDDLYEVIDIGDKIELQPKSFDGESIFITFEQLKNYKKL